MSSIGAAEGQGNSGRRPSGTLPLALAIAGLVSCWNPLAAPFGLGLGLAGAVIGTAALRRGAPRRRALVALTLSLLAVAGSVAALAISAGSLGGQWGEPVVQRRTPAETDAALRDLAERTSAARGRARDELSRAERQPEPARERPRDAGTGNR